MNCFRNLYTGNLIFYLISRFINQLLITINLFQIITIFIIFLKNRLFTPIILKEFIYYYLILFSIINFIIFSIFEYFRKYNKIFQRKKLFIIFNSYIIITIDIILLSIFISYLFVEFKSLNKDLIILHNKYNVLLIIFKIVHLIALIFNIIIFQLYKYYTEENNFHYDNESIKTESTYDEIQQLKEINFKNSNEFYFQKTILDKITIISKDSFTQTI